MAISVQHTPLRLLFLNSWIKAGTSCGINALDVFDAKGIDLELENFRRAQASPAKLLQVLEGCTKAAKQQHFPLVLGELLTFDQEPIAETFLATSPSLRNALKLLDWALPNLFPLFKIHLHEHEDEAWVTFAQLCSHHDEPPLRYVTEATMMAMVRIAHDLLGEPLGLLAVHFTHDKPPYHTEYMLRLKTEPRYQQTKNAIFFKRQRLDQPLPGGRGKLHDDAFGSLIKQLPLKTPRVSFSQQVMDRLLLRPELLSGNLDMVAESFGMSSRTLQRRLNKEGQGFTDVLNLAQQSLATQWLEETVSDIQSISIRLGYQSRRAFTSAFKLWTGETPSQYRARIRAGHGV